uniref:Helicase C-terminal domain-containing protein n=1 Tax=Macrostomum lignano TaxID=282301 RepID=A0A1I8I6S6_9PLAT
TKTYSLARVYPESRRAQFLFYTVTPKAADMARLLNTDPYAALTCSVCFGEFDIPAHLLPAVPGREQSKVAVRNRRWAIDSLEMRSVSESMVQCVSDDGRQSMPDSMARFRLNSRANSRS